MATKRKSRSLPTLFNVYSDAHAGRKCTPCKLCGESASTYTHPVTWKNKEDLLFLREVEPCLNIKEDSCICRNCRINVATAGNVKLRDAWKRHIDLPD